MSSSEEDFEPTASQHMQAFYKALVGFQGELKTIEKATKGHHGKYANLPDIVEAVRPLLKKHGLFFSQELSTENEVTYLKTTLGHSEGGCQTSQVQLTHVGNDIKTFGAAITYYRRYTLNALLGVVTDENVDNDPENDKETITRDVKSPPIDAKYVKTLMDYAKDKDCVESFLTVIKSMGIKTPEEIPQAQYYRVHSALSSMPKKEKS